MFYQKNNEIRVRNNPKVTYKGRIISGDIAKPGKVGDEKKLPNSYYKQEPDMYFTTTGQVIAPTEHPEYLVKYTNRKTTGLKKRIGSAQLMVQLKILGQRLNVHQKQHLIHLNQETQKLKENGIFLELLIIKKLLMIMEE